MSSTSDRRERGSGSIEYRADRKNPYRAKYPVEVYIDEKGRRQTRYKMIGSFETRKEAEIALYEYGHSPYDMTYKIQTFEELYERWMAYYSREGITENYKRTVQSAYSYCSGLYKMNIKDIGPGHIRDAMQSGYIIATSGKDKGKKRYASPNTQERIKSLCNMMFDYAVERRLIDTNPARAFKINKLLKSLEENRKVKEIYSDRQVAMFWEHMEDVPNTDMILIALYTGFRPQELIMIETKNVHLEEGYIVGGMKTDNGKDRTVPIHPKIQPLIEARMEQEQRHFKSGMLFNDTKHPGIPYYTYFRYRNRFNEIMANYGLTGFSPHCTRHTFATFAKICGMDPGILKRIIGHSLKADITESVYIHPTLDDLKYEMEKLDYATRKRKQYNI